MRLNVIAPTFDSSIIAGAGVALVELVTRFIRDFPGTKIYLNDRTATEFPQWDGAVVPVNCGSMRSAMQKAIAVAKLEAFGFPSFPRDGVCWFPFGPMLPRSFDGVGVATIHDTLEQDLPALVPLAERIFRRVLFPPTIRATVIATDSRFSAQRLEYHYGARARVIPLGMTPFTEFSEAKVPRKPYAFYPANSFPHKNHRFLLELWQNEAALANTALVFTMGAGMGELAEPIQRARAAGIDVIVTGRVSRAELAGLYRNAICAVLPSLYEGFGLPMQEALLCGCPAVANAGCDALRETVISDYPLFLPLEPQRWAETIRSCPHELIANFRDCIIGRSWDDCATDYISLFEQVGTST